MSIKGNYPQISILTTETVNKAMNSGITNLSYMFDVFESSETCHLQLRGAYITIKKYCNKHFLATSLIGRTLTVLREDTDGVVLELENGRRISLFGDIQDNIETTNVDLEIENVFIKVSAFTGIYKFEIKLKGGTTPLTLEFKGEPKITVNSNKVKLFPANIPMYIFTNVTNVTESVFTQDQYHLETNSESVIDNDSVVRVNNSLKVYTDQCYLYIVTDYVHNLGDCIGVIVDGENLGKVKRIKQKTQITNDKAVSITDIIDENFKHTRDISKKVTDISFLEASDSSIELHQFKTV